MLIRLIRKDGVIKMFHFELVLAQWADWILIISFGFAMLSIPLLLVSALSTNPFGVVSGFLILCIGVFSMILVATIDLITVPNQYIEHQSSAVKRNIRSELLKTHRPLTMSELITIKQQFPIVQQQLNSTK